MKNISDYFRLQFTRLIQRSMFSEFHRVRQGDFVATALDVNCYLSQVVAVIIIALRCVIVARCLCTRDMIVACGPSPNDCHMVNIVPVQ